MKCFIVSCYFCSSEGVVYAIDEITGALQVSHRLNISSKDYPGKVSHKSHHIFSLETRYCITGIFYRPLIFAVFALPMIAPK